MLSSIINKRPLHSKQPTASMMMPSRAIKLILGVLLAVTTTTVKAIYPDDHWSYSKQLTEANFETTIQSEIDAGKTMFVRWIASPG
jgi:hypothetical protein